MKFIKRLKLELVFQLSKYFPVVIKKGLPRQSKLYGNIFYNRRPAELNHTETLYKNLDLKDKTIMEIGSFIGEYAIYFGSRLGRGKLIAVEPNPINCALLCKNIKANKLKNVTALNCGLSNKSGEMMFVSDRYNRATGTFKTSKQKTLLESKEKIAFEIRIPVKTGDQIADEMALQSVDYVKIDTEGFEPYVIEGFSNILTTKQPLVDFAIHGKTREEKAADLRRIVQFLKSVNYKAYKLSEKMEEASADNVLILQDGAYIAYCQPKMNVEEVMNYILNQFRGVAPASSRRSLVE